MENKEVPYWIRLIYKCELKRGICVGQLEFNTRDETWWVAGAYGPGYRDGFITVQEFIDARQT